MVLDLAFENKKFFICLVFLLLFCSPVLASPYLWAAHETIVSMDDSGVDLNTAHFFCLTLEAADSEDDMPELSVNFQDRNSIPKFTIFGGNYTYWNGDGLKTITGTTESFDIARSDTVMYNNHSTLAGSDNLGYVPTNDAGDWIHFFNEADNGLNGVAVSWEAQDNSKIGSGIIPDFKTTKEQLEEIVPYIEYIFYEENDMIYVSGFNWRFVYSDDVTTAVSTDKDITVSIRYTGGDLEWWDDPNSQALGDNLKNGLDPVKINAGETLEGTVEFPNAATVPYQTIFRYYIDDEKEKCYQWRFLKPDNDGWTQEFSLSSVYVINVPIINGQPDYKYSKYYRTQLEFAHRATPLEARYYDIGKLTIDGDYSLMDQNNVPVASKDYAEIPIVPMGMPGDNGAIPMLMMKENFRPVAWEYLHDRYYARWLHLVDETGDSISGKTMHWTFSEENSWMNGSYTMPEYKSVQWQLSEEGFFPYVELVYNDDDYITAVKFRFVQSPDIDTVYTPENFAVIGLSLSGLEDHEDLYWGGNNSDESLELAYNSNEWTLENPVKPGRYFSMGITVPIYTEVANTWEDWLAWLNNGGDRFKPNINYSWILTSDDAPVSQMALIDDDSIMDNLADTLSEDIFTVQREEISGESENSDEIKEQIESGDTELVGRFNQLNVTETGLYAVTVNLPDELYDELAGTASSDLAVYPVTYSDIGEEPQGPVNSGDIGSGDVARVAGFFSLSANENKSVGGNLLASDGKAFDTVNTKEFILTAYLKLAEGENYTNYKLYLGRGTSKPQTPEEIQDIIEGDETQKIDPDTKEKIIEAITKDETQKIDSATKEKIANLISSGEYEVKTINDISGDITEYRTDVNPNESTLKTISEDFKDPVLSCVLPAFTLSIDKPVILILKVTADNANNLPLHLFKMKDAKVTGSNVKLVKFASASDTGEDKDAVFYDGTKKIDTLSSNTVYVAAEFENGSYAPFVITGNNSTQDTQGNVGSSSSGCNLSLLGFGALILLMASFKKNN